MVVGKVEVISFVLENPTYQFYPTKPRTALKSCSEVGDGDGGVLI